MKNYSALSQSVVWNPQHSPEEDYEIPMQFSAYDIEEELKKKLDL